ncbi:DUF4352 domain-containing protein [Bacillus altitudinis]|uniref:DUF4352 domain-containing protein n=1 Tax=Bacillus TaxID=1386 RepID=UPI001C37F4D1|nr:MULTISPECIES: DUF4352 domain-containing protein [Bacillus]MBV5113857.1 DUF4352 domain-containing protein [Bacillus altitudinis]MBW2729886.1 DUF4352 domain-containing protein [Bacillus altitudinis]MCA0163022.1 DUF4352 domain-containing protein [Bacillus sp. RAR_M1_44]
MKKFFKIGCLSIIILILIIIFVSCMAGGGSKKDNTSNTGSKNAVTSNEKKNDKEKTHKIGDKVAVEDFTYQVNSVTEAKSLQKQYMSDVTTDGKFVIVEVTVKNTGKKGRMVDTEMFRLIGKDGTEYKSLATNNMYVNDTDSSFFLKQINPKLSKKGRIAFEVPNEKKFSLQVSSGLGWTGGKYKTIDLSK